MQHTTNRAAQAAALAVGAQRGDRAAANDLAEVLRQELERIFLKKLPKDKRDAVDDAVQVALIRVHRHIEKLRDPQQILPWVRRIAGQIYVDHAGCVVELEREPPERAESPPDEQFSGQPAPRKTKRLPLEELDAMAEQERDNLPEQTPSLDAVIERREFTREAVALCHEKGHKGAAFVAVYLGGLSHAEAAAEFKLNSAEHSRTVCHQMALYLRSRMTDYNPYVAA